MPLSDQCLKLQRALHQPAVRVLISQNHSRLMSFDSQQLAYTQDMLNFSFLLH